MINNGQYTNYSLNLMKRIADDLKEKTLHLGGSYYPIKRIACKVLAIVIYI